MEVLCSAFSSILWVSIVTSVIRSHVITWQQSRVGEEKQMPGEEGAGFVWTCLPWEACEESWSVTGHWKRTEVQVFSCAYRNIITAVSSALHPCLLLKAHGGKGTWSLLSLSYFFSLSHNKLVHRSVIKAIGCKNTFLIKKETEVAF